MKLAGKVAIVTGAGPNIGREICLALAREGAWIAANDIDAERAEATANAVKAIGGRAIPVQGDVSDSASVQAMVKKVVDEFGRIDILVNNAAITVPKSLLDTSEEEWDRCLAVIMRGTFLCSKYVAREMVAKGIRGRIVNIASTSAHRGRRNAFAYCSAKGGILNLTRAAALDLAKYGIRVNSVTPTKTGISVGGLQKIEERRFDEIPLGRLGRPIDQANAVVFLVSDDADFITGADLRVDGGALATWGVVHTGDEKS